MADSPPRSEVPDSASGGDLTVSEGVDDEVPPEQPEEAERPGPPAQAEVPELGEQVELPPWGMSPPWWSPGTADGSGPQIVLGGTGPHALPGLPNGTGPHVLPDGTGPLPAIAMPGPAAQAVSAAQGARKRMSGLLLGAGVAAVLVVAMAGVLVLRQVNGENARTAAVPASKKRIAAAALAGGLHKDTTAAPVSSAYPFVAAAVRAGGVPVGAEGVYASEPRGPLNVLFMGGTGPVGDTAAFLQKIRPTTYIAVQSANAGKGGGRALCGSFAVLADVHLYCAWATKDSYGVVASNVAAPVRQLPAMAELMRGIRQDVEGPRR
ncbi:hypothetical protein [Actinomadura macra]|uniref:hypothetical protein n=1 Tax=Actinomadura macra TaxID=46164 RepID=UPI00082C3920|nr:hypothetical protein [Actinomadura macra]